MANYRTLWQPVVEKMRPVLEDIWEQSRGLYDDLTDSGPLAEYAPADPGVLALPNPERARIENVVDREEKWQALAEKVPAAGIKRNKQGRYIGGPPTVLSPQKRAAVVNKYADRVKASTDAGIPPGYFYEEGSNRLAQITDNPAEHELVSQLYGPTSTQVGPFENSNYAIRALDQKAMGVPTSVGIYPNAMRRQVDSVLAGEDPATGYKTDRYSDLLGPRTRDVNPLQRMPPNDMHEGHGTGWPSTKVPSGPTQVAWSDDVRARAGDKVNLERATEGERPLELEELQELHWAAIRAETDGRPLQINPKDTIQGSLDLHRAQGAWEAEPGASAGIERLTSKEDYADEVYGVLADDQGKDKIVRAMGGRLQDPIVRGTGVWEGELSPGFQSPSYVSHTKTRGMHPASEARMDSTEAVRQYMLGQEGRAFSMNQPNKARVNQDIADVVTGGPPSPEETARLQGVLGEYGIISPTAKGYRAVSTGYTPENKYHPIPVNAKGRAGRPKRTTVFADKALELSEDAVLGKNLGGYRDMDWAGGNATRDLFTALDSSGMPGPGRLADSPETRQIAGEMAQLYKSLEAQGKLKPNQKLTYALELLQTQGLDALRKAVGTGRVPYVVLPLLYASQGQSPREES